MSATESKGVYQLPNGMWGYRYVESFLKMFYLLLGQAYNSPKRAIRNHSFGGFYEKHDLCKLVCGVSFVKEIYQRIFWVIEFAHILCLAHISIPSSMSDATYKSLMTIPFV